MQCYKHEVLLCCAYQPVEMRGGLFHALAASLLALLVGGPYISSNQLQERVGKMAMKDWQQAATVHAPLHAAAPAGEAMGCEKCHGWVEHDLSMAHLGNPAVSPQPFHSHMCRMCARKRVRAKATMCTAFWLSTPLLQPRYFCASRPPSWLCGTTSLPERVGVCMQQVQQPSGWYFWSPNSLWATVCDGWHVSISGML